MAQRIEDYAMIGDTETAALVGRDGSIDWLCLPRFDSGSCFAKLLGHNDHGRWLITVDEPIVSHARQYQDSSMILQTDVATEHGAVRIIDFMPPRHHHPRVVRIVKGMRGAVPMRSELSIRFEYGLEVPWVHRADRGLIAVAGPNAICLDSPIELKAHGLHHEGTFVMREGEELAFGLGWYQSHEEPPFELDASRSLQETTTFWKEWCAKIHEIHGEWQPLASRSLMTLKALTYAPTGGVIAAVTTSLPESLGGTRNWDYRYCWVRDASLTLDALIQSGLRDEARAWMNWLARSLAGDPNQMQIMYGPAGERRLTELELDWLPGYEESRPVRIGNAAAAQFQLDVSGELMDVLDRARSHNIDADPILWHIQLALMEFLDSHWSDPDEGIWEIRGPRRQFTHSKMMAWVAFDRSVRAVERYGLEGPVEKWRASRAAVHREVCQQGWNPEVGAFTQYYGSKDLDASILQMPLVRFLPAEDKRVVATVEAVQRHLMVDGFVARYQNRSGVDGLVGTEGSFLPCTLWLVGCLVHMGRVDEAKEVFNRVVGLVNDVGLISEEYDTDTQRLVGNFPQAFTHVGIVNAARSLTAALARRATSS